MSSSSASHYATPGSADDRNKRCEMVVDGPSSGASSDLIQSQSALATKGKTVSQFKQASNRPRCAVAVYVRTRPSQHFAENRIQISRQVGQESITLLRHRDPDTAHFLRPDSVDFTFPVDGVLHNASQEEVYQTACQRSVKQCLNGINGAIICYGQVGSGKSYTLNGSMEDYGRCGVIPKALAQVFGEKFDIPENSFKFHVSYLEIYNDVVHDLLSGLPTTSDADVRTGPLNKVTISEDNFGIVTTKGLLLKEVASVDEAMNCLFEGDMYRAKAPHCQNATSSRSHAVFTLYVQRVSLVDTDRKQWVFSRLDFVDLAGFERPSKTQPSGKAQQEVLYINQSLSYLEQTLMSLAAPSRFPHPPFRQSKLPHLLKHCIGGDCETVMIANIRTEEEHAEETISTLKFVERSACIPVVAKPAFREQARDVVERQQFEIEILKEELAAQGMLFGNPDPVSEPFTDAQVERVRETVLDFIYSGDHKTIKMDSIRHLREMFEQFRRLYKELRETIPPPPKKEVAALEPEPVVQVPETRPETEATKKRKPGGGGKKGGPDGGTGRKTGQAGPSGKTSEKDDKPSAATTEGKPSGRASKKSLKSVANSMKAARTIGSGSDVVKETEGVGDLEPDRDGIGIRRKKSMANAPQDPVMAAKLQNETRAAARKTSTTALSEETVNQDAAAEAGAWVKRRKPIPIEAETCPIGDASSTTVFTSSTGDLSKECQIGGSQVSPGSGKKQDFFFLDKRPPKEEAFEWYKTDTIAGKELNATFIKAKEVHRDQAIRVRDLALGLSKLREAIDQMGAALASGDAKAALRVASGVPAIERIDNLSKKIQSMNPREFIQEVNSVYQAELKQLAAERNELLSMKDQIQEKRRSLVSVFDDMYAARRQKTASKDLTSGSSETLRTDGGSERSLGSTQAVEAQEDEIEDLTTRASDLGVADVALDTKAGHMASERKVLHTELTTFKADPRDHARTAFNNARIRAKNRESQIIQKTGRRPGTITKSEKKPTSTLRAL